MPNFTYAQSFGALGYSFTSTQNATADGAVLKSPALPPAKAGTLTLRTSDSVGEITLGSGHGVTTGDELDIYFASGIRVAATVGTVAGNVVPFSLGGGDNLPAQGSPVTVMVPHREDFVVPTATLQALAAGAGGLRCVVRFVSADPADVFTVVIRNGTQQYAWAGEGGNPFDADDVVEVYLSHESAQVTRNVTALAMVN
jgi:hypothetical protein